MAIATFDRTNLRLLRADVEAALAPVAARHGISLAAGGIKFSERQFTMKVEAAVKSPDGDAVTREAEDWGRFAEAFGLPRDALGRTVHLRHQPFVVAGIAPNRPKRPILLRRPGEAAATVITTVEALRVALRESAL